MTTVVASPPSFQSLPRLGWNGGGGGPGGFNSMSAEEVSRIFMPQRKGVQRTNSSSSIASSSSSTSTITTTSQSSSSEPVTNGDSDSSGMKKKPRGGFWPAAKPETSTVAVRPASSASTISSTAGIAANNQSSVLPSQIPLPSQSNGARIVNGQSPMEPTALLALLPLNGTFERKQINVPFFPDVLRVGRQTNAKTVPTPLNGFFDSKVLSRQHAEVWAERNGKVWIRDVKSSNGTFVNGQRLSPENRDSEPHELHQHDTLELGIDIVSEDQKTIVHHKVSAKVEYVGLPGSSNNVLDLNFGDLDPSHGGSLLASPISSPMVHSRSRPGNQIVNGRMSTVPSLTGNHLSSLAQQRQMNFWGAPLNVEHLVKTLSTEMKAAHQQSQDLEQTGSFMTGLLSSDGNQERPQSVPRENSQSRQTNGRMRGLRLDPSARFAEPPAPPPQQPLPEKPDLSQGSPAGSNSFNLLRRNDTAKFSHTSGSPTNAQSSQILSLVEALSLAKKELDSQGAKVRHLEEMLQQERSARESAEERARRLEQRVSSKPVAKVEEVAETAREVDLATSAVAERTAVTMQSNTTSEILEKDLQLRLDHMVSDMQRMKQDMKQYQERAESAESDALHARTSLSEMITRLREQNASAAAAMERDFDFSMLSSESSASIMSNHPNSSSILHSPSKSGPGQANGHVQAPSRLPENLERAVATMLRDSGGGGHALAQSAPYVSMMTVVLLGVGLMAYLNSWQKAEK